MKWFLFLIVVFLSGSEFLSYSGIIHFPVGSRHLFLIASLVVLNVTSGRGVMPFSYLIGVILMLSYLILAYLSYQSPTFNYILGYIFTFLFVFVFIASFNIKINNNTLFAFMKLMVNFLFIASLFSLVQSIIGGNGKGLVNYPGVFREAGAMASMMNIGVITSLTLVLTSGNKKYLKYAFYFTFIIFLTILKKTMVASIAVWILFYFFNYKYQIVRFSPGPLVLFLVFIVLWNLNLITDNIEHQIRYYNAVGVDEHVRFAMYAVSMQIAQDFFPFGSGLGTFASLPSLISEFEFPAKFIYQFNDIYYQYGVANIAGNSELKAAKGSLTHLDTWWPHILAELGFIGSLIFLYLWFWPVSHSIKYLKRFSYSGDRSLFLMFYILSIIISLSIEGLGLTLPEIPLFIFLHSGISGLIFSARNDKSRLLKTY